MAHSSEDLGKLRRQYSTALREDNIPFWEKHSIDEEQGGYFTCLSRDGSVFDTDKFVWLQARQVWTFSMLYNHLERNDRWLRIAKHGADFLTRHGMDAEGNWYFSLARDGRPLVQPYNVFSDCFAAMAFSQYAQASGDAAAREVAQRTYANILRRKDNPKGKYSKAFPGTRPLISLAIPMILANLALELEWLLEPAVFQQTADSCLREVLPLFLDPDRMLLCENVRPDGSREDSIEGRVVNPGHGIEAMWFLMDLGERLKNDDIIRQAAEVMLRTLESGWDPEWGGILYFLDRLGKPPLQLDWDQKLWWVHVETEVALLKAFRMTRQPEYWEWYVRVHEYTWAHFPDPEYGEWYGYLNRRGEVLLPLKGGKWKGCFHVPRGLYLCLRELEKISASAKE